MFRALDTETRTKTSRDGIFTMEYFKIVLLNWSHDFFVNFVDSYPPQGATHVSVWFPFAHRFKAGVDSRDFELCTTIEATS